MKGQISIEFLTILSVFLIVFIGVTVNLMQLATKTGTQLNEYILWKKDKNILDLAVKDLYLIPGSKKTVFLRNPNGCEIKIDVSSISINCNSFSDGYSKKDIFFFSNINYTNKSDIIPVEIYSN